jgi:uncharacterized protein YgiM (DUF1202 family)
MKRRLLFLVTTIALLLGLVAVQSPVQAAGSTVSGGIVVAHRLRVHQAASLRSPTIAIVKRGEMLTILGKNALRPRWFKVQTSAGVTGWVSLSWVRLNRGILLKNIPVVS